MKGKGIFNKNAVLSYKTAEGGTVAMVAAAPGVDILAVGTEAAGVRAGVGVA